MAEQALLGITSHQHELLQLPSSQIRHLGRRKERGENISDVISPYPCGREIRTAFENQTLISFMVSIYLVRALGYRNYLTEQGRRTVDGTTAGRKQVQKQPQAFSSAW
ncbi:hypothetical protein TREES_T100014373 [Tupaia chinensis]|uniref:Uncharacterized protein n=1 Tax=Tupaia chinensis TaxID=246437 RepID=L9JBM1_TUPCH|nr:hypothetical protein TREES_T100014373 [Tupaia chinensis]